MMRAINLFLFLLCLAATAWSQTARVQIIHNSASPTVDIWVNNQPFLTDFKYRTATPFVDVPAGVALNIGVAPSPSTNPSQIIANFNVTFDANKTYTVIASGLVGNPTTPFTLNVVQNARERAANPANVEFVVNHGATDAPAVDVLARKVAKIVSNASYGDVTNYIGVPPAKYTLDVTPAGNNNVIVASYTADLSALGGGAATVFASGFLNPGANDPAFGLFAALPDGKVLTLPKVANNARVQIIHNSASPTVDIWVNNQPFLTNFKYRTATPFVDVPAGTPLNIGVAPSPSTNPSQIIASFNVNFKPDETYTVIASGLVGSSTTPFTLNVKEGTREKANDANSVEFIVNHGSTDAPAVDVLARKVAKIVTNAKYGDITDYIAVPAAKYTLDITPTGNNNVIVASYTADLSALKGGAATVFASGFLSPGANDPAFGLFAVLPDGKVLELPKVANNARVQIIHNSASPTVDIWVNNQPFLTGFKYRTATPFVDVPAGTPLEIGVAPSPSTNPSQIIARFNVNFKPDETYTVLASGVVGDPTTPFTLVVKEGTREKANDPNRVEFIVNHGATDAPSVDVLARNVATLVTNARYGDVTDYIAVPAAKYTLDVTPTVNNALIVASFTADLSALSGGAATVFASGFLNPATGAPAFGLFAALPDGRVLELPKVANTARVQIIHNSASPTVDIWVNNQPFLTDFKYRTATPFVNVPAGTPLEIGVAPSPSTNPSQIIARFNVNFKPDETYTVIASGLVGSATTPFTLNVVEGTREKAANVNNVELIVNHGSTDAPAVDVVARGVAKIVSNAKYGDVTDYISVPPISYTLDITPAGSNDVIVASYTADLSTLKGGAATVFASGFLSPGANDPAFGLFAALPDGKVLELPRVTNTARVQIIHNSASPTVDIWVNNQPFLTNFKYRTATPYVNVPAGTPLVIGVAPSPSTNPNQIIARFNVNFKPNETYVVIASGLVGNATTPFTLIAVEGAREQASNASNVEFLVNHGSTDAPAVDVLARNVAKIVSNAKYGDVTNYIGVPPASYTLDITPANQNATIVASYTADLSGLAGKTAVVFASGFLSPGANQPGFGLWVALADGKTFELPVLTNAANPQGIDALDVFPNPVSDVLSIKVATSDAAVLEYAMFDLTGRLVGDVVRQQVGQGQHLFEMNMQVVSPGQYFLRISTEKGMTYRPLVVE